MFARALAEVGSCFDQKGARIPAGYPSAGPAQPARQAPAARSMDKTSSLLIGGSAPNPVDVTALGIEVVIDTNRGVQTKCGEIMLGFAVTPISLRDKKY